MVLMAEYAMSFGFFRRVQYLSFAVGWGYHCVNGRDCAMLGSKLPRRGRSVSGIEILQLECRNVVKHMYDASASYPPVCALLFTCSARLCVVQAQV